MTETVAPVTPPPATPTLTLTSLKPIIVAGDSATLNWGQHQRDCLHRLSRVDRQARGLTGTAVVKPTVTTSYTLTCTGAGRQHRPERDRDGYAGRSGGAHAHVQ